MFCKFTKCDKISLTSVRNDEFFIITLFIEIKLTFFFDLINVIYM